MSSRRIACTCGALELTVEGDPIRVSVCHCLDCQKRSGSVFAAQARFARDRVTITGDYQRYTRTADSGNPIHFHFCPICATTAFYVIPAQPDILAIPVGLFGDPDFPAPDYSVYEERMHHWVTLPDDMERLA